MTHLVPMWLLPLWRRLLCPRAWHAFDEVYSPSSPEPRYLSCDACGLMVVISRVETKWVKP